MDEDDWVFHTIPIEELCKSFDTNIESGLSSSQAEDGNDLHGLNILTPAPSTPEWKKLCGCLLSGPSLPLWIGAVPCFVAYGKGFGINNLYLGATLSSIVTATGVFCYYQQRKLNNSMEGMKENVENKVVCRRDGKKQNINAEKLTLGDIVYLKAGDQVPADIRIIESHYMKVDNSNLTGESESQSRSPECTDNNAMETKNLAFYSTFVVHGSGVGMVVNIGDDTVMGKTANLSSQHTEPFVSESINRSLLYMSGVTVCIGGGLCVAANIKSYNWLYPVTVLLGLAPCAMYASMIAGIQSSYSALALHNCLVKDLYGLSTLGAINCICTSITGVLSQNKKTVAHVWFDNKIQVCDIDSSSWKDMDLLDTAGSSWKVLERSAVLCSSAEFEDGEENEDKLIKKQPRIENEVDAAIFKLTAATTSDNGLAYRQTYHKVFDQPDIFYNKYQLTFHEIKDMGEAGYLAVMKGAPEIILNRCITVLIDGEDTAIDEELKNNIENAIKELADLGERVIGFCDLMLPRDQYPKGYTFDYDEMNYPMREFRFVGLMSMIDPPRRAVLDAVYKLRRENIKLVMVTGEHPVTAKAVARSLGIISEGSETVQDISQRLNIPIEEVNPRDASAIVVTGQELKNLCMSEMNEILENHTDIVFARTSPQQKLIVMEAFQSIGDTVAVTGSHVYSTPALKNSDLGIALGIKGMDAAKDASDMILLDDNFANIVHGVEATKKIFRKGRSTIAL